MSEASQSEQRPNTGCLLPTAQLGWDGLLLAAVDWGKKYIHLRYCHFFDRLSQL